MVILHPVCFSLPTKSGYQDSALDYARSASQKGGKERVVACYLDIKKPLRLYSDGYFTTTAFFDQNSEEVYLRESIDKQRGNYYSFVKMLSCFGDVVDSAIGIETHNRNAEGYKPDPSLQNMYVLVSAFQDGENIVPVKLEIKEFSGKPNSLYVAIALNSISQSSFGIEKSGIAQATTTKEGNQNTRPPLTIRLADLFSNVNRKDESFLKYVPKQFLSDRSAKNDEYVRNSSRTNPDTVLNRLEKQNERLLEETKGAIAAYKAQRDAMDKAQKALYEAERKKVQEQYRKQIQELESTYSDDTATMQREFLRLLKEYGSNEAELRKQLAGKTKRHDKESTVWEKEFSRLLKEYESSGRNIDRLEKKVQAQREAAKAKVEGRRKTEMRGKIERTVKELNRYLLHPTTTVHVPAALQGSVAKAMEAIIWTSRGYEAHR